SVGPRFQLRLRSSSGGLRPNHQINVTVEHLQQGQDLIDRLAVVRLIEKAIQLRRGRPEPAHDLALRERALCDSLLCFERQSVQQEIAEICWILVVLEDLVDVHDAGAAGVENVAERLPASLRVNGELRDRVFGRGRRLRLREREHERLRRGADLEHLLPIVVPDRADLHSSPSASSSLISSRMRRVAAPFIGFWWSKSHFTISVSSRY